MEKLELNWTVQGEALKRSGPLNRTLDAVAVSPWGLDVPPTKHVMLPSRPVCNYGWQLYFKSRDDTDRKYAHDLYQAARRP